MIYISDLIASLQRMKDANGDLPIAKNTMINRVDYVNNIRVCLFSHCAGDKEESSHITIEIEQKVQRLSRKGVAPKLMGYGSPSP